MRCKLKVSSASYPLKHPFRISRGVKTSADVVEVCMSRNGRKGRGEGVPYGRYGETIEGSKAEIEKIRWAIEGGITRQELLSYMTAGAARNAVDAAFWDLEAQEAGVSVATLMGIEEPKAIVTAITIGLDNPDAMFAAAQLQANALMLKVKVDAYSPLSCIRAVKSAAPKAQLIVDPNESWTFDQIQELSPELESLGVILLEQPLAADYDDQLEDYRGPIPIAADESMHGIKDLACVSRRYQVANLKLDKTGGLTAALEIKRAARDFGLDIMVGCMVATSLSMAPALHLAANAKYVDLDGPISLLQDRAACLSFVDGAIGLPDGQGYGQLWGGL